MINNCIDCGKELSDRGHFHLRCRKCYDKTIFGKNNPNYGNNVLSTKYKGKNNPFYGQHHTEETKNIIKKKLSGKNSPHYIDGRSFEPYTEEFRKLRIIIRKRDNYTCQLCGIHEELNIVGNKKENLTTHHIDYNKENCRKKNLISLCRKCNSKVNHNRKYWKKYFIKLIKKEEY
jgi:DNA-directed RNA polymerase subunit RPC12/RpoP